MRPSWHYSALALPLRPFASWSRLQLPGAPRGTLLRLDAPLFLADQCCSALSCAIVRACACVGRETVGITRQLAIVPPARSGLLIAMLTRPKAKLSTSLLAYALEAVFHWALSLRLTAPMPVT